jgi:hypothetical protein
MSDSRQHDLHPEEGSPDPEDIGPILRAWPLADDAPPVRMIRSDRGEAIQVRIDSGLIQMASTGTPDAGDPIPADAEGIGEALMRRLGASLLQRAQAWMQLDRLAACVADCDHVVRLVTSRHPRAWGDSAESLQLMAGSAVLLRARAQASEAVKARDARAALLAIDRALDELGQLDAPGTAALVTHGERLLQGMRGMLVPKLPGSQRAELEARLRSAIAAENFELAAILRDELRQLRDATG